MKDWQKEFDEIYTTRSFDHDLYRIKYSDVIATGLSPLEHYVKYGKKMGRSAPRDVIRSKQENRYPSKDPLVSILCITYNHEEFISQTIESIIKQNTNFSFELIIGNDKSTDKTDQIISEYLERYPQIKYYSRSANLGANNNFLDLAMKVRGKYVAICEGDDYWTDNTKLQRQVDFLEQHPEYTVCFHPVQVLYEERPEKIEFFPASKPNQMNLEGLLKSNFIQTNSVMYRWRFGENNHLHFPLDIAPGDWYIHLLHAEVGRIAYIDRTMGVYRKHATGMWSSHVDAVERFKKLGNKEIAFYSVVDKKFGPFKEFYEARRHIFATLALIYIRENDFSKLAALISVNASESKLFMKSLGFTITSTNLTAEELYKDLLEQSSVDVIVTSYNHAQYISRCFDSILKQTGLMNIRIIVGDDKSTDETPAIIEKYRRSHPDRFVVLEREQNLGMLRNMKSCISACGATYVAFCEADDYWLSDRYLSKKLEVMRPDPEIGLCFNWLLLNIEDKSTYIPHNGQGNLPEGHVPFSMLIEQPLTANFSCCMYRRSAVETIPLSYFDEKAAADWLFNLYIAENHKVFFLKEIISVYTIHSKGQWSGISAEERLTLENTYRSEFATLFDRFKVENYSSKSISVEINDIVRFFSSVLCNLDTPESGELNLANQKIKISGWVLRNDYKKCSIIVRTAYAEFEILPDVRRSDVITSIYGNCDSDNVLKCGFSIDIDTELTGNIQIGLKLNDKYIPWASIRIEDHGS